ncbi:MAG: YfiR family protein, partial [Pseudomonadota bacterium]
PAPAPGRTELLRAAMIAKVARFVDWPAAPVPPVAFTLCVPLEHPLLAALRAYYRRASIGQLPVLVRALRKGEPLAGCRAAIVLPGAPEELAMLRAEAGREHVLLIGEGDEAAALGVHIGFFPDLGRMRVEVNRKALEASGLKASFRLLEVAKIVE